MTIDFEFDSDEFERQAAAFREALRAAGRSLPPGYTSLGYELNGQLCSAFSLAHDAAGTSVETTGGRTVSLPVLRDGLDATIEPDEFTTLRLQVTEHKEH